MHNLLHSKELESTTVLGQYDAPTNEDDYGSYFETIRNLLGQRTPHNTFATKPMVDQEMLTRQIYNITSNVNPSKFTTIVKCPTRKCTPVLLVK
jgi:hypothetical protein